MQQQHSLGTLPGDRQNAAELATAEDSDGQHSALSLHNRVPRRSRTSGSIGHSYLWTTSHQLEAAAEASAEVSVTLQVGAQYR